MVVGGIDASGMRLSSTEIMVHGIDTREMKWKNLPHAKLPHRFPLSGIRAVNYRNTIFAFGKIDRIKSYLNNLTCK